MLFKGQGHTQFAARALAPTRVRVQQLLAGTGRESRNVGPLLHEASGFVPWQRPGVADTGVRDWVHIEVVPCSTALRASWLTCRH